MPGHWLLAKMGKRVLRPGGLKLTRAMLDELNVGPRDSVIEFAPGLGVTARMTLQRRPAAYTAVERQQAAAAAVQGFLRAPQQRCLVGTAEKTGLPDQSGTVVYGEAMLSMQAPEQKRRIVAEAFRLLRPGGRYAIHELSLTPNDLPEALRDEISREMSQSIHAGVRPLTAREWRELLESQGFKVRMEIAAPMHLLEPPRLIRDECFWGALRFVFNVLGSAEARRRVCDMRRIFRRWRDHLAAIMLVAVKPAGCRAAAPHGTAHGDGNCKTATPA
jgi:ubiquinone/menaquinone biosynthesis C-methylase UbiE